MHQIQISFDQLSIPAELNDSPTARAIWQRLPLESQVNTWGEEIYFEIPIDMPQESGSVEILSVGDLGYWPVGRAFCMFFGPTPVSTDQRPRAYSPVNLLGRILGDCAKLKSIHSGEMVRLERAEADPSPPG